MPESKTTVEVFVYDKVAGTEETAPLSGATVSLLKAGAAHPLSAKEGTTDGTGHSIFPVDEAGEYVAEAHSERLPRWQRPGLVAPGGSHEVGIELVKETVPSTETVLTAVVTDAVTKRPVVGARVLARHPEQTLAEAARGLTDSKGQADLRVTREGNHTVLRSSPATNQAVFRRWFVLRRPTVQPLPSSQSQLSSDRCNLSRHYLRKRSPVKHGERLRGLPREASGQLRSVPGASLVWERVALRQPTFTQVATTGENGKYEIEVLAGQYQVRVEPPAGFERLTERVDVPAGAHEKYSSFVAGSGPRQSPLSGRSRSTGRSSPRSALAASWVCLRPRFCSLGGAEW